MIGGKMRFTGKVVVITGASSGIGAALSKEFAAQGATVVLAARRLDRLEELKQEIEKTGAKALAVECDVTSEESVNAAFEKVRTELGQIDVVVANAGFGVTGNIDRLKVSDIERQFDTNVYGVLRTIYAALPDLKKSKGRLVLIGSVSGFIGTPGSAAYAMSKFAVRALGDVLWAELDHAGVTVTTIHPGFIESEIRLVDNSGTYRTDFKDPVPTWLQMTAPVAARQIVRAVYNRRRQAVITFHGKVFVLMSRFTPCLVAHLLRFNANQGLKTGGIGARKE